jgi:uroporphyrinogen-III decarboxylase
MLKAARESHKFVTRLGAFINEMKGFGYSPIFFVATYSGMDLIGDNFRGTRGIMLDMYQRPEKLLKALDVATKLTVRMATRRAISGNIPVVFIPLHKGAEGLMSLDQFKTFYWPPLKSLINGIIDAGLIPWVYTEGGYTSRLEVIRDIPKGKAIFHFEKADMRKAKEVLGDVACISGNVPLSLLISGTTDDVTAYCKELIETVGKGGGFIMDAAGTIDEAKVENIRAMAEATRTYGTY